MKTFINFYLKRLSVLFVMMMVSGGVLGQTNITVSAEADDDGGNGVVGNHVHICPNQNSNSFVFEFINPYQSTMVLTFHESHQIASYEVLNSPFQSIIVIPANSSQEVKINFLETFGEYYNYSENEGNIIVKLLGYFPNLEDVTINANFLERISLNLINCEYSPIHEIGNDIGNDNIPIGINNRTLENNDNSTFNALPNPFKNHLSVQVNSKIKQNVHFNIYNNLGQIVYSNIQKLEIGQNRLQINTESLDRGIYFFVAQTKDNFYTLKIMK